MSWIWPILSGVAASTAALIGSGIILRRRHPLGSGGAGAPAGSPGAGPQEIGDFAILLGAGFTKRRAVALNYLSALTPIPGALLTFAWSSGTREIIGVLLPIAAGGFVYIALAGLVPAIHHRRGAKAGVLQIVLVLLGVGTIWALARLHG